MTALKRIRQDNRLSLERLASLLGVDQTELLNAENGHGDLDQGDQETVAGFFGCQARDLFDREGMARRSFGVPFGTTSESLVEASL